MRISILPSIAVLTLLGACSENTGPSSEQSRGQVNAGKLGLSSRFNCDLEGYYVQPNAVNAAGEIVGVSDDPDGFLCDNRRGVSIALGNLGGPSGGTGANAINASGQVVGWSQTPDEQRHAFVWNKGVMTDLGTLPGDDRSDAKAISDAGQVVGESTRLEGDLPPTSRAFLWKKGVMVDLGTLPGMTWGVASAINARGQVVGASGTGWPGTDAHAFLWENGKMTRLQGLGGAGSRATSINAAGQIAGAAETSTGEWHAVVWRAGRVVDLGTGIALAINNAGVVVGVDAGSAVFWHKGVRGVLEQEDPDIPLYYVATGINSSGMVVGYGVSETNTSAGVWQIK
jgi:probable HAF family extracellular repeat protein